MASYKDEVQALIISAASRSLNVSADAISPATDLKLDLNAKSVNFVQIIAELEDTYEVEIDFMAFRNSGTVENEAELVAALL